MKRAAGLVILVFLAASRGSSTSYYALEVRGGSRIYAVDEPVRKGRTMLFHRFPDGVFMSLAASEVENVLILEEPPQTERLAPGQQVFIGPPLSGPSFQAPPAAPAAAPTVGYADSGYGFTGSYWGGSVWPRPPFPPPVVPPSRIGSNGFPILAPPGSPGSTPLPIGPNGFPILAPQAPPPAPRPR